MIRLTLCAALLLSLQIRPSAAGVGAPEVYPNILLIVSEDNGPELGCYGDSYVRTPNLDKLAGEGVRFSRAYVAQAGCSQSRASILTGLYPHQHGQIGLATWGYRLYREDTPNIPRSLKAAGYRTGRIGKLHVNPESSFPYDMEEIPSGNYARKNLADYARHAEDFFKAGEKPFFLHINYPDAHDPFLKQVDGLPENPLTGDDVKSLPCFGIDPPELRQLMADYYNCVSRLDALIGDLLAALDRSGKADSAKAVTSNFLPVHSRYTMNRVLTLISALLLALYCEIAPPTVNAAGPPQPERAELHNSITLEGAFGKAEMDVQSPRMLTLYLRQPDSTLSAKSLLCACESEFHAWAVGGVTHVRGTNDVHYSSRYSTGHTLESGSSPTSLTISGIRARSADGQEMPATEDWTLRVESDGSLSWRVVRTWDSDFEATFAGEPALFFNSRPNAQPTVSGQTRLNSAANGVMANWWLQSEALTPENRPEYQSRTWVDFSPPHNGAVMRAKDCWAILKLYTSFPNLADLHVAATGGHLYRRASFNAFCEVGLTATPDAKLRFSKGDVVTTVLRLASSPQCDTGQQLLVEIPDREMQAGLQAFFGGLANCGALCDNANHDFGNQCDGFLYAGNMWMHAYSLLASVPVRAMSPAPVSYPEAFRKNLVAILQSVDQRGEVKYGFRHPQMDFPELGAIGLLAVEADLLYTGDVSLARAHRDTIQRMLDYFEPWMAGELLYVPRENLSDLIACPNWYYDNIRASGFILYHNLLLYRALGAAETIYAALGDRETAMSLQQRRERMRSAINRVFWRDDAYGPGRGGYLDWVADQEMTDARAQFISCGQYMAIVFGVADKPQAKETLQTADHFITQLRESHGYTREATLDNLVPHRPEDQAGPRPFGGYMNGGMLLAMTFWEVVARCQADDARGAHELLSRFAGHARGTNWYEGENAFSIDGHPCGWNGEPYLADQLVAAASLVHGFLGLSYTPDDFRLDPHLPPGWDEMSAEIQFHGRRYRVTAQANGQWTKEVVHPQANESP